MNLRHLFHAALLLPATLLPAFANVTPLRSYHLGDLDPGASNGLATALSREYISSNALQLVNGPTYSTEVPIDYPLVNTYSVRFTGANYGSAPVLTNLTDNFGLSAWVKSRSVTGSRAIAYNGHTGSSGWGLYQVGNTFQVLFGGVATFGSAPVVTNEWTHLALVRNQGTTTLYVNGVASGTSTATPNAPAGLWAIGSTPPSLGSEFFDGWIDEVAVFSFAPGAFNTSDLAYRSPATRTLTAVRTNHDLVLTWPAVRADFQLEFTTNLAPAIWTTVPYSTNTNSGVFTATETTGDNERYYRLHKPAVNLPAPIVPAIDLLRTNVGNGVAARIPINLAEVTTFNNNAFTCGMSSLGTLNPRTGTPEAFRYHWIIVYPNIPQYTDAGMHGFHRPALVLDQRAMADSAGQNVLFTLEIIDDLNPGPSGTWNISFPVLISNALMSLSQFSICQQNLPQCTNPAGLPQNDPNDPP